MSHFRRNLHLTSSSLTANPHRTPKNMVGARSNFSMTPKPTRGSKADLQHQSTRARTCDQTVYNMQKVRNLETFIDFETSSIKMIDHNCHSCQQPAVSCTLDSPKATISEAFEVSLKSTCNQTVRKKISDFKCQSRRLATSYYRWHNQTGRNNLWSTQFECSLRYPRDNASERNYYNYVKPIVYQDHPRKVYDQSQMICQRHYRSFTVK